MMKMINRENLHPIAQILDDYYDTYEWETFKENIIDGMYEGVDTDDEEEEEEEEEEEVRLTNINKSS